MRSELAHIFVALLHRRDWTVRLPVSSSYSNVYCERAVTLVLLLLIQK